MFALKYVLENDNNEAQWHEDLILAQEAPKSHAWVEANSRVLRIVKTALESA